MKPRNLFFRIARPAVLPLYLAVMLTSHAMAATVTMTANDSGSTYSFISAGKWSDLTAPSAANDYESSGFLIQYGGTLPNGGYTFAGNSLTLKTGARFYSTLETIGGGRQLTINNLTLDSGTLSHNRGGGNPITMKGSMTILAGGGTMYTDSDAITWAGTITGSGPFSATKGTVTLSGDSSGFSGNTSVTQGSLRYATALSNGGTGRTITVSNGAAVGVGYAMDNAFLNRLVENSNTFVVTLGLASANALDFSSSTGAALPGATLGAHANVGYTGALTPNAAGYRLGGGGSTLTFNPSSFTSDLNLALFPGAGTGTVNLGGASRTFGAVSIDGGTVQNGTITGTSFAGTAGTVTTPLVGTGAALTKSGSGTLSLNATNSYDGGTTISAGTLQLGSGSAGGNGAVAGDILNNGTLTFNNADAQTYSGAISGTGALTKSGAGTLTLNGTNGYAGNTTASAGVLLFSSTGAIGGGTGRNITVANSATLAVGFAIDNALMQRVVANANTSTIALAADSSNDLDFNSTTGSALTAASLGAIGTVTYSGTLTANGTTYRLGGGGGTLNFAPATYTAGNSLVLFNSGRTGTVNLGSASWSLGSLYADGGTTNTGSSGTLSVGSGSTSTFYAGVGYGGKNNTATLDASTVAVTANVGKFYVGVCDSANGNGTGVGTLKLGNCDITATNVVVGGTYPDANASSSNGGKVEIASGTTANIVTPLMSIGNSKALVASYFKLLGTGATLNLGNSSNRTALTIGSNTSGDMQNKTWGGDMDLSLGTGNLYLSSLTLAKNGFGGANAHITGTIELGSASNVLNISGATSPVKIGSSNLTSTYATTGTLTITNLASSGSSIEATDNSTAILVASKGGTSPVTGTLKLNGGTLTITTTGSAIADGGGTSALVLGNASGVGTGMTLKAGAAPATGTTSFITGLDSAKIKTTGVTFDTASFDILIDQKLEADTTDTGGGLTKAGAGTLTLSGINTYTGNTTVSNGSLVLADNAGLRKFVVTDSSSNKVTGAGTATLAGDFTIDTTAVTAAVLTGTWPLVDTATKSFDGTFTVVGVDWSETANVWTKTDTLGTWRFYESNGNLTLNVEPAGYTGWAGGFSPPLSNTAADADPDGDGLANALEYVFGTDPRYSNPGGPTTDASGDDFVLTFSRDDASETADVAVVVEISTDLVDWTTHSSYSIGADTGSSTAGVTVEENDTDPDTITVTVAKDSNVKMFGRLRAVVTE